MFTPVRKVTLEELSTLSESDEGLKSDILAILNDQETYSEDLEVLRENIVDYPPKLLYALAKNPVINKFLETDIEVNKALIKRIKKYNVPGEPFLSFDRSVKISTFCQLKGVMLLNEYYKNPDDENSLKILDEACEIGMYHALVVRTNYNVKVLRKELEKIDTGETEKYLKRIYGDVDKLSNLYWAMGSLAAAVTLINVVDCLYPIARYEIEGFFSKVRADFWQRTYESCPKSLAPLEGAMETLYFTQMIHDFEESRNIIQAINQGGNIFLGYENRFDSNEKLSKIVLEKLASMGVPCTEAFCTKAFDHAVMRIRKSYPDYHPPEFKFGSALTLS